MVNATYNGNDELPPHVRKKVHYPLKIRSHFLSTYLGGVSCQGFNNTHRGAQTEKKYRPIYGQGIFPTTEMFASGFYELHVLWSITYKHFPFSAAVLIRPSLI
jgi:hypothetical protein